MERNRQQFKRLFPPELFSPFIDVGHYVRDLTAYQSLVDKVNAFSKDQTDSLDICIQATNENKRPTFSIGHYAVYELLGSGAFGTVYKVKKKGTSDGFLALKQVYVNIIHITRIHI